MKKSDYILKFCLGFLIILLVISFVKIKIDEKAEKEKQEAVVSEYKSAVSKNDYIMHALGGIDEYVYTNSKEALEKSKNLGAKFYEVDVRLTADDKLVLTNGWSETDYAEMIGLDLDSYSNGMTYDQFMGTMIEERYTPLDFKDLVDFMKENPDTYMMLDFGKKKALYLRKAYKEILGITEDSSILDRMIVGGHNTDMVKTARSMYNFKLYNLYWPAEENRLDERIDTPEEFLDYCRKNRVTSVSTLEETYEKERDIIQFFRNNGLIVYVFTENDEERAKELLKEVDMVGTDSLV
ncbi:hypothetical protein IKF92_03415 [Candidatus Saccharibacteria bacterium]|nr:hypothetical protein [Candidatus Saccharibacteria bacterium]